MWHGSAQPHQIWHIHSEPNVRANAGIPLVEWAGHLVHFVEERLAGFDQVIPCGFIGCFQRLHDGSQERFGTITQHGGRLASAGPDL